MRMFQVSPILGTSLEGNCHMIFNEHENQFGAGRDIDFAKNPLKVGTNGGECTPNS